MDNTEIVERFRKRVMVIQGALNTLLEKTDQELGMNNMRLSNNSISIIGKLFSCEGQKELNGGDIHKFMEGKDIYEDQRST